MSETSPLHRPQHSQGRRNNFDAVRLVLASLVYLGHYTWILPSAAIPAGLIMFVVGDGGERCVQSFFVISGFLMFQSFARSGSVSVFYEKRIRRIIPGYTVVIMLSAMLGVWFSNLTAREYFSTDLLSYLGWNLVFLNFMHPTLPGVFEAQPVHVVNGPLWTLKIEVAYYIIFPFLYKIGKRVGFGFFFCLVFVLSEFYVMYFVGLGHETGQHRYLLLAGQLPGQLRFFVAGALVASVLASRRLQGATHPFADITTKPLAASTIGAILLAGAGFVVFGMQMVANVALAAVVLTLCLRRAILPGMGKYGDLSYGVYIVHFPILQAIRSAGILDGWPVLQFVVVTTLVYGLAAVLWRFVEGPALEGRWIRGPNAAVVGAMTTEAS